MDKYFTLPDPEEMIRRLDEFNPSAHTLHELLAKDGGTSQTAHGFLMVYALAAGEYTEPYPPPMAAVVDIATHRYVRLLIDDEEARAEALQILGRIGLPNS